MSYSVKQLNLLHVLHYTRYSHVADNNVCRPNNATRSSPVYRLYRGLGTQRQCDNTRRAFCRRNNENYDDGKIISIKLIKL